MLKLRTHQYLYIILTAIFIQGCMDIPSNVVMPQWDVDLNVPFALKTYTIDSIMKKANSSIYLQKDNVNNVYLIKSDTYKQTVLISDFILLNTESSKKDNPVNANDSTELLLAFPKGAKVNSATFTKGTLKLIGHNPFPTFTCTLTARVIGLTDSHGNAFVMTLNIPPNSQDSVIYDLAGARYVEPPGRLPFQQGLLDIKIKATSTGVGQVVFDFYSSNFDFSSVYGYLPKTSLGVHNNNFALNLGDAIKYRGNVVLKTGSLTLSGLYVSPTNNPFIVEVNNLQVVGKRNNSHETAVLSLYPPAINTFRFVNGNFNQVYNETNSNITDFIAFLPDSINVTAEYIMNPDNDQTYRNATNSDSVTFTTNFSSKSQFALTKTSFSDTLALNISQNSRDQILKGKGVSATVEIQNAIPLKSSINIIVADSLSHPLFVIRNGTTGADSISFPGATVVNDTLNTPSFTSMTVNLDSSQIRLLAERAQYAIVSVNVETSGGTNIPVYIRIKDWIKLNVYGRVTYRIKEDKK